MIAIEAPANLDAMISECRRELGVRRWLYSVRVAEGKMTRSQANHQIDTLESIQTFLEAIRIEQNKEDEAAHLQRQG